MVFNMAFLVNTTNKTLNIGGITLPPLGMGESNTARSELSDHLFVRSGWVELGGSGGESAPKRGRKPKRQDTTEYESNE